MCVCAKSSAFLTCSAILPLLLLLLCCKLSMQIHRFAPLTTHTQLIFSLTNQRRRRRRQSNININKKNCRLIYGQQSEQKLIDRRTSERELTLSESERRLVQKKANIARTDNESATCCTTNSSSSSSERKGLSSQQLSKGARARFHFDIRLTANLKLNERTHTDKRRPLDARKSPHSSDQFNCFSAAKAKNSSFLFFSLSVFALIRLLCLFVYLFAFFFSLSRCFHSSF